MLCTLTVTTKWNQVLRFQFNSLREAQEAADVWIECNGYQIVATDTGTELVDHIVLEATA